MNDTFAIIVAAVGILATSAVILKALSKIGLRWPSNNARSNRPYTTVYNETKLEEMIGVLREIRDSVRDHNRDAAHRHDVVMLRLDNMDREITQR